MQAELCQHQKPDGTPCQCVANRSSKYCRHHARYYDPNDIPAGKPDFEPPIPDHPDAHLLSVHQATRAFLSGKIDAQACRLLIYAARVESSILQQRIALERLAYERAREQKKELAAQQHAQSRTLEFLEALRENGYRQVGELDKSPEKA